MFSASSRRPRGNGTPPKRAAGVSFTSNAISVPKGVVVIVPVFCSDGDDRRRSSFDPQRGVGLESDPAAGHYYEKHTSHVADHSTQACGRRNRLATGYRSYRRSYTEVSRAYAGVLISARSRSGHAAAGVVTSGQANMSVPSVIWLPSSISATADECRYSPASRVALPAR